MDSHGKPGDVLGVDRARSFTEAEAIAEDLRSADAGDIDEAAQRVESKESGLLLRVGFVWGDGAGFCLPIDGSRGTEIVISESACKFLKCSLL